MNPTSHPSALQRQIQAVLFDLDGTLIDSAPDLAGAVDTMRVTRGLPSLALDVYRPMAGAGARGMLQQAFGMHPEDADFETMREEFFCNYERRLTQSTFAFAGVAELIQDLVKRQIPWGVVTNKVERFTLPLTAAMPIFSTAACIVSGDTTAYAKPHPLPLQEAAMRIGIPAQHCMYVGDDERDIRAGRSAGMHTVAATYGYLGECTDVISWGADAIVDFPLDVLKLLD